VAPVPAGNAFTERQQRDIEQTLQRISADTGVHFSAYVGNADGDVRTFAQRVHESLGERAPGGVLILIAPNERRVEIVTGAEVRHRLTDRDCALAALAVTSAISGGDVAGGITNAVEQLGDRARRRRSAATR
jgi:uncharacterized membrane protein YgcG